MAVPLSTASSNLAHKIMRMILNGSAGRVNIAGTEISGGFMHPSFMRNAANLLLCAAGFLWLGAHSLNAETFSSSGDRAILIELFSSEGCSSCPPADQWVSELKTDTDLWVKVVPVVFHVDYWDGLGWPDPFASPDFTRRQRDYSTAWGRQSVYTPGFVANGQEWKAWFSRKTLPGTSGKPGILRGDLAADGILSVHFDGNADYVEVVLLGMGLKSDVKRGENRGQVLEHDFIALHLLRAELKNGAASVSLSPELVAKAGALAFWVKQDGKPDVVQVTGGWLVAPRS